MEALLIYLTKLQITQYTLGHQWQETNKRAFVEASVPIRPLALLHVKRENSLVSAGHSEP